jgi:methyl-accepting chemotaxis protein
VEHQSAATEEISTSIQSITSTIQVTADEAHASAVTASKMNTIAEELMSDIGKFHVEEDAGLAIDKAKSAHMVFIGKIKAHIDGAGHVDSNALTTHTTCAFGKWYQSIGKETLGSNDLFRAIDAPHALVHDLGRQAVQVHDTGNWAKARILCGQMETASMELIGILDKLAATLPSGGKR